jgi:hypothetical protein
MDRSGNLRRLVRLVGAQAAGLERLDRTTLRRGRVCVGCTECDGVRLEPGLGWVCPLCDEVLDLVYEIEIANVVEARKAVQAFLRSAGFVS